VPFIRNGYGVGMDVAGAQETNQPIPPEAPADQKVSPELAIKTSEKLLDYLKHDTERATAEIKVAEERARGNATIAAAAIPLITFLRALEPNLSLLQVYLIAAALLLIVAALLLILCIMWLQRTERADEAWYAKRQEDAYYERQDARYDRFLHELQSMWIGYLEDARRVRDVKYRWLRWQNVCVLLLLVLLAFLLWTTIR